MADISTELTEILEAEKGEDVRLSIYNALQKMNNQIVSLSNTVTGATGATGATGST